MDLTLTGIAHKQAAAMAAKDQLDHDVLGGFNSRINPAGAGRAAENIAYGYDSFPKTLGQWIDFIGAPKEPAVARRLPSGCSQREKRYNRAYLLGDGDCRRLRTSQVNDRYEASSCGKAQGSHKGNLPLEDFEYLPLMPPEAGRKRASQRSSRPMESLWAGT